VSPLAVNAARRHRERGQSARIDFVCAANAMACANRGMVGRRRASAMRLKRVVAMLLRQFVRAVDDVAHG